MNPAARLVIGLLGIVAILAVATLCLVALRTGEVTIVKDVALLVLGAVSGVLAKVGVESGSPTVGPVENATVNVHPEEPGP